MKHILCYGDSNTWGYIPESGLRYDEHTRWTGVLQDLLGEEYRVHEDGLNSRTSTYDETTKPFLNGIKTLPPVLSAQKPLDAVVLCLGTNDLKHMTAAESCEGVRQIIRLIRAFDDMYPSSTPVFRDEKRILLLSPIALGTAAGNVNPDTDNAAVMAEAFRFPELLRRIAGEENTAFLDLQSVAEPSEEDGMHMTPEGHRAIGRAVADMLIRML